MISFVHFCSPNLVLCLCSFYNNRFSTPRPIIIILRKKHTTIYIIDESADSAKAAELCELIANKTISVLTEGSRQQHSGILTLINSQTFDLNRRHSGYRRWLSEGEPRLPVQTHSSQAKQQVRGLPAIWNNGIVPCSKQVVFG